ncbi:BREX system P-loop protein BrxC [Carboxylicivirga sp. N1Y90]|uniref:BREX system P-loop protein BrxC n=1 Tax=Carboxylicivirga fragile TaxID=3417571 RepID=UPI003D349FC9|nr:BREX system P-loop protein BrxC [Marinilabiliaceae bacterium N1Y90]
MLIQNLYDKDITRRINPAVVVSEMEDYFIKQEIDEYVFTQGITKNIYKFLNAVANKKEGKTGVWISGYYGSGKSHFIKYLFYCLNKEYRQDAFSNFKESLENLELTDEPTLLQVSNLQKSLDQLTIEEIIFNIDAVSDQDGAKDRITRVLLNQLNAYRGYNHSNIALALYLEKPLDKKGHFQAFKDKIKSAFNTDWTGNQNRFARMYLDKVIQIAMEFDADIDKESLKKSILDRNQDYTIEFLIDELKDYLSQQDDNYRLLFLMDEVSQYIGSNTSLLLNLQTIVEEVGAQIGQKVWIVCTAQQELSNLIDNTDSKAEDFGKIMGRFETMISLESQDAAYITKRRVLDKNSDGLGALSDYYKENKGAIENQFVFDHDLYENFNNKEDFTLTYPFIPYQFRLISDVFESFSQVGYVGEGVKNTERAILGITHYTANLCKDSEVGYFVPFDLFFNEQLEKNLTHHARGILDRAYSLEAIKNDEFSRRVVSSVFMISNLGESQSVNFPANVENLALLMMDSVDTSKMDMQSKVQSVLDVMVSQNIIQVSEGKYRFLKEDEIEVAHIIRSTVVTNEDRLDYIYKDIILKVLKPTPVAQLGTRNFKIAISIDDKEIGTKGDFNLKFSIYDTTDLDHLAHSTPSNDIIIGISEWFNNDTDLRAQVLDYVRTQKYISSNRNATGTRAETIKNFGETNKTLLDEIKLRFENKFQQTAIISKNQVITSDDINGGNPNARFVDMVKKHMEQVYHKHNLSSSYATTNAELLKQAKQKQKEMYKDLSPAEEELNNKLNLFGEVAVVGDVVKQFEKDPYGWKDICTLDILLRIAKKGHRRFEWKNEEINLETYADKALNSKERDSITILKEKVHSQEEIDAFRHAVNDEIFNETLIPSNIMEYKEAVESFRINLQPIIVQVNQFKNDYESYPFHSHLKIYHKQLETIYHERNPEKLVSTVMSQKEELVTARDTFMFIVEFEEHNFKAYADIANFTKQNENNFTSLEDTLNIKADELVDYFAKDKEPWEKFPQMRKAYKEVHGAIKTRIENLRTEVVNLYETIFEEIEKHRTELGLDANITPASDQLLNKIGKEGQITMLENYQLNASNFRAENFKKLENRKAEEEAKKTGKSYVTSVDVFIAKEMSPQTIETPEQLDDYIKKLRERLMVKLAKNKKIFLN